METRKTPEGPSGSAPRGRPRDLGRRDRTVERAVDHVMAHGLDGFGVRPLAAALGTSPRMLLYDFDSGEQLLLAVVRAAEERVAAQAARALTTDPSPRRAVLDLWRWFTTPGNEGYARFALEVRARRQDGRLPSAGASSPFLDLYAQVGAPPEDHLIVRSLFFGLLGEHLYGDTELAARAIERFAAVLRPD